MFLLFQRSIFRFRVSFPGCTNLKSSSLVQVGGIGLFLATLAETPLGSLNLMVDPLRKEDGYRCLFKRHFSWKADFKVAQWRNHCLNLKICRNDIQYNVLLPGAKPKEKRWTFTVTPLINQTLKDWFCISPLAFLRFFSACKLSQPVEQATSLNWG